MGWLTHLNKFIKYSGNGMETVNIKSANLFPEVLGRVHTLLSEYLAFILSVIHLPCLLLCFSFLDKLNN